MSARPVTVLTCDKCRVELRIQSNDPGYVAGWSSACGWSDVADLDLCPDCLTAASREAFDDMFADVLAELESETG